jgi:hypothetical protein
VPSSANIRRNFGRTALVSSWAVLGHPVALTLCVLVATSSPAFATPTSPLKQEAQVEEAASTSNSEPPQRAVLDRIAVRFYSPETGGAARPRFLTERTLSFEARVLAMSEQGATAETPPQERHLRLALDRHVAEELLASLGIEGAKDTFDLAPLADEARAELERRIGGRGPLERAAAIEQLDLDEVEAFFLRQARAIRYLDRHVAPLLSPAEEQLRDVFRSSAHPFRDRRFEEVKKDFVRWFIAERVKAAETTFLQTARARIKIVIVGH